MVGFALRDNGRGLHRLSVLSQDIAGTPVVDVSFRDAAELTLAGDVTAVTWTGWDPTLGLHQSVTVKVVQDATGGHTFNWEGVEGNWLEFPPAAADLDALAGEPTLSFRASTTDGGATVDLEPIAVLYTLDCTFADGIEIDLPDISAGGTATISHPFELVTSVELVRQLPVGRRVLADWWQQNALASADVNIDFAAAITAGDFKARVGGKLTEPCELKASLSLWESTVLSAANATTLAPLITHDGNVGDVLLDPGDGSAAIDVVSAATTNYAYGGAGNYAVTLRWRKGVNVSSFRDASTPWSFNVSSLPRTLDDLRITGTANTVNGRLDDLPPPLTFFQVLGQNTMDGSVANLPAGLTFYQHWGQNTAAGSIANLPAGLTRFEVLGNNTTSGSIETLPAGLLHYFNAGLNLTSGLIDNLPATLTYFRNQGNNTTSGSIENLPVGLDLYYNHGTNTTSGLIDNLPATLTYYENLGQNTTSGLIDNMPVGLYHYENTGLNTVGYTGGYAFASMTSYFQSIPATGHTVGEVDQILIDIAAAGLTPVAPQTIDLNTPNPVRSAASDAAVATLTTAGWTVTP